MNRLRSKATQVPTTSNMAELELEEPVWSFDLNMRNHVNVASSMRDVLVSEMQPHIIVLVEDDLGL